VVFVTHDIEEAIYLSQQVVVLTRAPARISQIVTVDLAQPRTQLETREQPMYLEYRRRILRDIMSETHAVEKLTGATTG
jgi:NitT/TauT family transport system ATP-binding protein